MKSNTIHAESCQVIRDLCRQLFGRVTFRTSQVHAPDAKPAAIRLDQMRSIDPDGSLLAGGRIQVLRHVHNRTFRLRPIDLVRLKVSLDAKRYSTPSEHRHAADATVHSSHHGSSFGWAMQRCYKGAEPFASAALALNPIYRRDSAGLRREYGNEIGLPGVLCVPVRGTSQDVTNKYSPSTSPTSCARILGFAIKEE
jgi:hypothetical protein